ncbi:MAG: hypothetical protein LUC18_04855 [Porphyromonadaceae bacterium]|nr:hypothetical protein [Porphyromonadaceae bacterium]
MEDENPTPKRAAPFRPPSIEEIKARCREMNYTNVDPCKFFDFYESKGWMVGKNRMKKWHCALANWARDGDFPPGGRAARATTGSHTRRPEDDFMSEWQRIDQERALNYGTEN